jgi:hypothetical protein
MTVIDLNPLEKPEPIKILMGECVVAVDQRDLYEASKRVTADFDADKEGYMEQVRASYEEAINSTGKIINGKSKPKGGFKINQYQADVLWTYMIGFIDDLFKKKLDQE